jgi:NAD(P)-dependent dehydrogenase (short-subunit alcohol dehydrogenase family)
LRNKIILITGSTDGIGKEAAIDLIKQGAHVIIHGRNKEKTRTTIKSIKDETQDPIISGVSADFSSLVQIKDMADNLYERFDHLDVLINNAGVFRPEMQITTEGLELTFMVNYVAPFYLTNLLIDLLKKSDSARIVNVASQVQSNHLDFDNLQFETGYTAVKAYARSKTCFIMFTYLLAEKLKDTNITVNTLHPGVINTKLLDAAMGSVGAPVSKGADTLIYAAMNPELKDVSGKYFKNNSPESSKEITYNKELQKRLWQKTEEIIKQSKKNH